MTLKKRFLFLTTSIVLASGCASINNKGDIKSFDTNLVNGELVEATNFAIENADLDPTTGKPTDLLWALQAGATLRAEQSYTQSIQMLDDAEVLMKSEDLESTGEKGTEVAGSILLNDNIMDYEQATYEGIMVNTYKALNFMANGDISNARVEWNRADDRQRRAIDEFSEKIKKKQDELNKERTKNKSKLNDTRKSAKTIVAQSDMNMDKWKPYKGYVNPFTSYMHGLFFLTNAKSQSDYDRAYDSLKRTYSLTRNGSAKLDMQMAKSLSKGSANINKMKPTVWVIFENGLSVNKKEWRIDLPVFIVDNNVSYVGMALPKLVERKGAYPYLEIQNRKERINTKPLASMDRIIQAEFKVEFPYIVAREVLRTTLKTIVQKQANDDSGFAGFALSVLQMATTGADIRMWTALPKEWQVARFSKSSNNLTLNAKGMKKPVNVCLGQNAKFSIVYVKSISAIGAPIVEVINLK